MIDATNGEWRNFCPENMWKNLKRQARKYHAASRKEHYKTGGGISMAPDPDEFLELVVSLLGKSAAGMDYRGDCDYFPQTGSIQQPLASSSLQQYSINKTSSSSFIRKNINGKKASVKSTTNNDNLAKQSSHKTVANTKDSAEKLSTLEDYFNSDEFEDFDDPQPIFDALKENGNIPTWGNDNGSKNLKKPKSQPLQNIISNSCLLIEPVIQKEKSGAATYKILLDEQIATQRVKGSIMNGKLNLLMKRSSN
ncbi:uncharacterized protein [Prorops nasuta]|uniref:uncharacterized protein n=1 Tax=Prorops nasuta TaxID=863751 RepID=UPI0034CD8FDC